MIFQLLHTYYQIKIIIKKINANYIKLNRNSQSVQNPKSYARFYQNENNILFLITSSLNQTKLFFLQKKYLNHNEQF